jgi:predicted nucleotidyltransferase
MSLIAEDYQEAIRRVVRDLEPLGDSLVSAYVYGSTARGEARPGSSDVDVSVFLRCRVWESRESFQNALEVLERAGKGLMEQGIPFDGSCHYAEDETRYMPAPWQCEYLSPRDTRLVAGREIASKLDRPLSMPQLLREFFYLAVIPGTGWLAREDIAPGERADAKGFLLFILKTVPQVACGAAGHPSVKREAAGVLSRLFPDIDLSVLEDLQRLRSSDDVPGSDEIKALLKRALVLIEDLHRKIMVRSPALREPPVWPAP